MCGEQGDGEVDEVLLEGSPPRVRGTACFCYYMCGDFGITPACAGNRRSPSRGGTTLKDHPRVCGEQDMLIGGLLDIVGSPPRVRGTVLDYVPRVGVSGITPACAGTS